MNCAASATTLVVGATIKLLIRFEALGCAEVKLCSAVRAKQQAGKEACSAGFCVSPLILTELLYPQPGVLINDRFLHIWDDLPFLLRLVDGLMNLVADRGGLEIHSAAGVLSVC